MKITRPAEEVELCDVCHRESTYFDTCKSCARRYCITCDGKITGCIHRLDICRICETDKRVNDIAKKYAPLLSDILRKRDKELME